MSTPPDIKNRLDAGAAAFEKLPLLESHVGYEALKSLKRRLRKEIFIDAYLGGQALTGIKLLGVSLTLAGWIRRHIPEKRVGLVLPPGLGATLANLACVFANKTPVNFNFTAGRALNESAIQRSGVKAIITGAAVVEKLKDFPWTEHRIDLKEVLLGLPKPKILGWMLASLLLPARWQAAWAGIPTTGGHDEVGLLFTSGSVGEPKGVVLSHRNVLANTHQTALALGDLELRSMLGCLPIFHSFGCTVTFWWPLLGGPQTITYPSPMETPKLAEIVKKYGVELMINTPTFLRAYLRKTKPEQLQSLKLIVTGAEKLPDDLRVTFEEKFHIPVCQGYGMTEATPVVATNLIGTDSAGRSRQKPGTVGVPFTGISVRIRDPETDAELPLHETGMLWLKGANIFEGYLNDPQRTAQVLHDGWYKTGDLGRLDEDGFLVIEGRLTRFSKIAGEMVPHGTIEIALREVLDAVEEETMSIMVAGVPDPDRGEELVLLTTRDLDLTTLRPLLAAKGLPNLWIPKRIKKVAAIPVLASGKLDLRACADLARD